MSRMREEVYEKLHPMFEALVDITCGHIEKLETNEEEIDVYDVIDALDNLKLKSPEQKIIIDTPYGSAKVKIGDAQIYEGNNGEIVIDSE